MKQQLIHSYQKVRDRTTAICQPLAVEDYVIQSMEDVSPPKWHLAHTTWFFETFLLLPHLPEYSAFDPMFQMLFNSYYQSLGNPYPRMRRGLLSRPTVEEVYRYRQHVDECLCTWLDDLPETRMKKVEDLLVMGMHHEQQHQELLLMDIKYNFSIHPAYPAYIQNTKTTASKQSAPMSLHSVEGGIFEMGYGGRQFCFDNELPRHQVILKPYLFASRLVTNREFLEFIHAGGYQCADHWLSDGWDCVQKFRWDSPLYWRKINAEWFEFTLTGLQRLHPDEPVSHVSYYEADAYARWRNLRLPSEAEWEHYANLHGLTPGNGNFLETGRYHPAACGENHKQQLFGDLWEWTSSAYSPYPGYKPAKGALGEYNGKFMSNQYVLRGGCCVTPRTHIRESYRNFFQPDKRWQFSGIRLADDA
ncbi:Iron(II)-dependent oxidoreductase EgtB [Aquicella siphonis]|uniref:Iron(II)-dependent oxidoreductase EgtB n=1 Tax=Aquicella siphonis TaxID=254247 RepID=A0A5E4PEB0_9COXI|nr:Iron(II)-dependent oxidoreductase EgtB [Aquicella siphonis]